MNIIKPVNDLKNEVWLNRNTGTIAWFLHRITGLALAGYIFLHLTVLGSEILFGDGAFNQLMGTFEQPLVKILEICLVGVIMFHLINGLRLIIIDMFALTRKHLAVFWAGMVIFALFMALTIWVFISKV
ncbi:MAG: succinate dehydrogenase, cytochrome b556 subunit [Planctomycetes bacterium]|nr:succinate dehydrogenase, cytochrome b556 subunit [Planctomycetota bacterium]